MKVNLSGITEGDEARTPVGREVRLPFGQEVRIAYGDEVRATRSETG